MSERLEILEARGDTYRLVFEGDPQLPASQQLLYAMYTWIWELARLDVMLRTPRPLGRPRQTRVQPQGIEYRCIVEEMEDTSDCHFRVEVDDRFVRVNGVAFRYGDFRDWWWPDFVHVPHYDDETSKTTVDGLAAAAVARMLGRRLRLSLTPASRSARGVLESWHLRGDSPDWGLSLEKEDCWIRLR
jgi:hypothetical protein